MMQRMNAFTVAPAGIAALSSVEKYVLSSGLDPKLIALTKIRVSQMNGCTYCLHMHTERRTSLASQVCDSICSMLGVNRIFFHSESALHWLGRKR
jgi:alkylhydroperoxidase family enzyme